MNRVRAAYAGLSANLRGAVWMLLSALAFTSMATLVKFLGEDYPAALQTFYRQLASTLVLAPIILRDPVGAFRTSRPGILIFRAAASVVALSLTFYSYQALPMAEANALSFTRTLWVVPLAILVLGERVGPVRIAMTLVGFCGVLIMVRPGEMNFSGDRMAPVSAALFSALLFAATVTGAKMLTRDHSTRTVLVWAAVLGLVLSVPPALMVWRWPTFPDLILLALMGVLATAAQACYIKGLSQGDAAALAPIDYSRLLFAVAAGFLFFHETPDAITMLGAGVVIASTLYITLRDARSAGAGTPDNT